MRTARTADSGRGGPRRAPPDGRGGEPRVAANNLGAVFEYLTSGGPR